MGFTTDLNMFINEARTKFINGEEYPFKMFETGTEVIDNNMKLLMQFG